VHRLFEQLSIQISTNVTVIDGGRGLLHSVLKELLKHGIKSKKSQFNSLSHRGPIVAQR
jgi:hypothetical protein